MDENYDKAISDMYLAAALISYGAKLVKVDRKDRKRQKFCFKNSIEKIYLIQGGQLVTIPDPSLDTIETEFIAKTLMLLPNYPDAIRSIKSSIHIGE
jgi:hypothetical protein